MSSRANEENVSQKLEWKAQERKKMTTKTLWPLTLIRRKTVPITLGLSHGHTMAHMNTDSLGCIPCTHTQTHK